MADNTFDVDFSDIDAVFRHLQDRYGKDSVARVGAYTKFTCKSGLRKVMSTFGFTQAEIAVVVAWLPKELDFTLQDAIEYSADFKQWWSNIRTFTKFCLGLKVWLNIIPLMQEAL